MMRRLALTVAAALAVIGCGGGSEAKDSGFIEKDPDVDRLLTDGAGG